MTKKEETKVERFNLPWVVKQVEGFEEKTVRGLFSKILSLLGEQEENLRDSRGQVWFDKELAEFIVWTIRHIDSPFLQKTLKQSGNITAEESLEFQNELLSYIDTIEEPAKSKFKAIANELALEQSQALFEKTLENVKELVDLYQQIPTKDRIELLERLNPAMGQWKEELKKRIDNK